MKTIKELREASGMNRNQFCEYFGIPYRTIQDWELGNRKCPEYLLELMKYKLKASSLIDRIEEECRIAQDHNVRVHTDWILNLIRADMDKEDNTSSVVKSLYDKRKKCVENSNYMGNPKSNGFGQADMERGATNERSKN